MNHTHIPLIPKVSSPSSPQQFRPISLCNVLYKIIAKVLANRLKWVLEEVIDKAQSAFVPGRQIFDNALVAFEIVHSMKEKHTGKVGWMALKLDMSKAYDRVEWRYLEGMMRTMGFPEKFILLIMKCVRSVTYSIMINGKKCGHIKPSRGIRQGDPLSPYLFFYVLKVYLRY